MEEVLNWEERLIVIGIVGTVIWIALWIYLSKTYFKDIL